MPRHMPLAIAARCQPRTRHATSPLQQAVYKEFEMEGRQYERRSSFLSLSAASEEMFEVAASLLQCSSSVAVYFCAGVKRQPLTPSCVAYMAASSTEEGCRLKDRVQCRLLSLFFSI